MSMSISISFLRPHQHDTSNHRFEGLGWAVMKKLVTGWLVGHASVSSRLWQEGALTLPILEQSLVCGMSLGYADPEAIENSLITAQGIHHDGYQTHTDLF